VTETLDMATGSGVVITPDSRVFPKRNSHRGMLPATWTGRTLRLEYADANGRGQKASGTLLDWTPVGPVLNLHRAKTVIGWGRIVLYELVAD
jgi:hypothetical protein